MIEIIPALIAIILGLVAIFKLVLNMEIAIGFMTITFGILAVIWTAMAKKSLSKGSSLEKYTTKFLFCLIFILAFSVWQILQNLFYWEGFIVYPKYFFIAVAYLIFMIAAYQILHIGKEFGFREQAKKIEKVMKKKKRK